MNLARRRASASSSERRDEGNGMITVDLSLGGSTMSTVAASSSRRITRTPSPPLVAGAETAGARGISGDGSSAVQRGRDIVGTACPSKGRRRFCTAGATSARCWICCSGRYEWAEPGDSDHRRARSWQDGAVESAIRSASGSGSCGRSVPSQRRSSRSLHSSGCGADVGAVGTAPSPSTGRSAWRLGCVRETHRIGLWPDVGRCPGAAAAVDRR
jgi:hypothetical protein